MTCSRCGSENQSEFGGEINLHFPGLDGIDKPFRALVSEGHRLLGLWDGGISCSPSRIAMPRNGRWGICMMLNL